MTTLQRKSSRIVLRPSGPKQEDGDYTPYAPPTRASSSSTRSSPSTTVQTRPTTKKSSRDPASRKAEYNRLYYAKNRGVLLKKAAERARTIRNPQNVSKKPTIKIPAPSTSTAPSTTRSLSSIASSEPDLRELSSSPAFEHDEHEDIDVEMPFWEDAQLLEALVPSTAENSEIRQMLIDAHRESMALVMHDREKAETKTRSENPLPAAFYKKR
ncbi:hypothetical protein BDV93DRAFT_153997 [Ceratobasidium sp. AG-I]|nr:hypothetical protein BDV93DRAFT_153997 [Ceratobasidium sp. AG-I]